MRRLRSLLPCVSIFCGLGAAGACDSGRVSIDLAMRVPQGLLDDVTGMTLTVSEGARCDAATGSVTGEPDSAQSFDMDRDCGNGAKWCKEISLENDGISRVFHVVGKVGTEVAGEGCAEAVVDQDPLRVDITIRKFVEAVCCNDGVLQPGEQCDPGIQADTDCAGNPPPGGDKACFGTIPDAVCECDCLAKEIVLSTPNVGAPAVNNDAGTKTELALAFAVGGGALGNALRAVYTDSEATTVGGLDVDVRLLDGRLFPIESPATLKNQLRLPLRCSSPAGSGLKRQQRQPAIASLGDGIAAIVYGSDEKSATRFDAYLSAQGSDGCADAAPEQLNVATSASCELPDVAAGPSGAALVVWVQAGALRGRIWQGVGNLVPASADIELGDALPGSRPRLAGTKQGWVVAYAGSGPGDADGIVIKTVSSSGDVGTATVVNTAVNGVQDQPDVASLADGRFVVAWRSDDKIFFQRFDASGAPRSGDQDGPLTVESPLPATVPAVTGGGEAFAVAWSAGDGTIWGRFLGADSGSLFNSVNGQNDDFRATHPGINHARTAPAIAMGGDGFVAIGWHDASNDNEHHGVVVRRFPLPE